LSRRLCVRSCTHKTFEKANGLQSEIVLVLLFFVVEFGFFHCVFDLPWSRHIKSHIFFSMCACVSWSFAVRGLCKIFSVCMWVFSMSIFHLLAGVFFLPLISIDTHFHISISIDNAHVYRGICFSEDFVLNLEWTVGTSTNRMNKI